MTFRVRSKFPAGIKSESKLMAGFVCVKMLRNTCLYINIKVPF